MIINFSTVLVTSDGRTAEVIVPGVVQSWRDLSGYKKFEDFLCALSEDSIVEASVTVYGCDTEAAEVSGFASMLIRIARDYRFVGDWCTELSHSGFRFAWSPSLQCGIDL